MRLLCKGCNQIIDENHEIMSGAPTGERQKEFCPVWVMKK